MHATFVSPFKFTSRSCPPMCLLYLHSQHTHHNVWSNHSLLSNHAPNSQTTSPTRIFLEHLPTLNLQFLHSQLLSITSKHLQTTVTQTPKVALKLTSRNLSLTNPTLKKENPHPTLLPRFFEEITQQQCSIQFTLYCPHALRRSSTQKHNGALLRCRKISSQELSVASLPPFVP